jgi:hypothetical protein
MISRGGPVVHHGLSERRVVRSSVRSPSLMEVFMRSTRLVAMVVTAGLASWPVVAGAQSFTPGPPSRVAANHGRLTATFEPSVRPAPRQSVPSAASPAAGMVPSISTTESAPGLVPADCRMRVIPGADIDPAMRRTASPAVSFAARVIVAPPCSATK